MFLQLQVQAQMGVTGVEKTFFFVYFGREERSHLEVIRFDENRWRQLEADCVSFFIDHVVPQLIRTISSSSDVSATVTSTLADPTTPGTSFLFRIFG